MKGHAIFIIENEISENHRQAESLINKLNNETLPQDDQTFLKDVISMYHSKNLGLIQAKQALLANL